VNSLEPFGNSNTFSSYPEMGLPFYFSLMCVAYNVLSVTLIFH